MLSVKQEALNSTCKVIGLTNLGIKPDSGALEADALLGHLNNKAVNFVQRAILAFALSFILALFLITVVIFIATHLV